MTTEMEYKIMQPEFYSLQVAHELGRLDLVTTLLAILAIIIGILAICGFAYIKYKVGEISRSTAERVAKEVAEEIANEHMQTQMPEIIQAYRELAENAVRFDMAGKIAAAQSEDSNAP